MREILYRGKGKCETVEHHKGDWLFGDYARLKDGKTTMHFIYGQGEIDIATLGQYTGLKDKNGTKIFEGDIVIFTDECDYPHWFKRNDKILVKWDDITSGFSPYVEYDSDCCEFVNGGETEIIGNIYDNPELLKGE